MDFQGISKRVGQLSSIPGKLFQKSSHRIRFHQKGFHREKFQWILDSWSRTPGERTRRLLQLTLAGILAYLGSSQSQSGAIAKWEKDHTPSEAMIHHILQIHGFSRIQEQQLLQRMVRFLPSQLDENGSLWTSSPDSWVLHYQESPDSIPYRIYSQGEPSWNRAKSQRWLSLGKGWAAMERLVAEIEKSNSNTKTQFNASLPIDPLNLLAKHPGKSKRKSWKDPRALEY